MPLKKATQRKSKDELHQQEAAAKYSSLLLQSKKAIRKELKVVKSFECQKNIRKIKSMKEEEEEQQQQQRQQQVGEKEIKGNGETANTCRTKLPLQQLEKLDAKLKLIKNFDIDCALEVALQRVGLKSDVMSSIQDETKNSDSSCDDDNDTNSNSEQDNNKSGNQNEINVNTAQNNNSSTHTIVESLLKHKRVSSAMQSISEKVADYNSWLSRREEWLVNGGNKGSKTTRRIERGDLPATAHHRGIHAVHGKKRARGDHGVVDVAGHDGTSGLFIESLSGNAMPDDHKVIGGGGGEEEGYEEEGGGGEYSYYMDPLHPPLKKNRPGQRARKAKAMAIEAKMSGKVWDSSINWREKKKKKPSDINKGDDKKIDMISASGLDKSKEIKVSEVVNMGKDWKEQGKAHPSWAAREAQKAKSAGVGIVAYAGKKITFDD